MKQSPVKRNGIRLFFLIAAAILASGWLCSAKAAAKTVTCTVTFANSSGTLYKNKTKTIRKGSYLTLPSVSKSGYQAFWIIKSDGRTTKYLPGKKVRIVKNTKFYLYYYRNYTVKFYTLTGKKEYVSLRITAYKGQTITLPSISSRSSSKYGWGTSVNATSIKKFGSKVTIQRNISWYLVARPAMKSASEQKVILRYADGTLYKTLSNTSGNAVFPSVCLSSTSDDNVLGWSEKKGQSTDPDYLAGDKIPATTGTWYMVVFKGTQDLEPASILTASCDALYLVGDSRGEYLKWSLQAAKKMPDNLHIIAKSGQGLTWFQKTGYGELKTQMRAQEAAKAGSSQIVIMNLGVNDLARGSKYIAFMRSVSEELRSEFNCELYYMSVNPLNSATLDLFYPANTATEQGVTAFNDLLYRNLCSGENPSFTWIDTCSYLLETGWSSIRHSDGTHDGIHYSVNTSFRIYNYCIQYINSK